MSHTRYGRRELFLAWFIANLLAVVLAALVSFLPHSALPIRGGMLVASLVFGLPIGFAQWIALRRAAPISVVWIFSISVAIPLALVILNNPILLGAVSYISDESLMAFAIGYAVVGLIVGLIQWLLLRDHFAKSFMWPPVSSAGLGLGMGLVLGLISSSGVVPMLGTVFVYAIVTGSVISWMHPSAADDQASMASAV